MTEIVSGKSALAQALFRVGALRFGRFTQPSGGTTAYHLDLRVVPSDPEAYGIAVAACKSIADSLGVGSFDAVVGLGVGGIVLASPLAHLLMKPLLCLRAEGKEEARVWAVEGALRPRWRTVLVADQVATGGSMGSAVEALRKAGCAVKEAVALVDRQEGARTMLAAHGVTLNSFVGIGDLAESLYGSKGITKAHYEAVIKQMQKTAD